MSLVGHYVIQPLEEKLITIDLNPDLVENETVTGTPTLSARNEADDEDSSDDILSGAASINDGFVNQIMKATADGDIHIVTVSYVTNVHPASEKEIRLIVRED